MTVRERAFYMIGYMEGAHGHYLIPSRRNDDSLGYKACEWLVDNGYAVWLTSHMGPGVVRTSKPVDEVRE